jgi:hypothetical protein
MTQFQVGQTVTDRDGFTGTIRRVTEWNGSIWYDVRFQSGEAVRYDSDLTRNMTPDEETKLMGALRASSEKIS